jgi:Zn-dependent oligopeptidase
VDDAEMKTKFSKGGEGDNAPLIERILTLRAEKAKLLGYGEFLFLFPHGQID